jgi:hypothetical protein
MSYRNNSLVITATLLFLVSVVNSNAKIKFSEAHANMPAYLFKSASSKRLVETARDHQWSIQFHKKKSADTLNIIAIRVEFKKDESPSTTGCGKFSIVKVENDQTEQNHYQSDTVYKFDKLPHDANYFKNQLNMADSYFNKVSRGQLKLESTVYPLGNGESGYEADTQMQVYSPGTKKAKETWDQFYYRKTLGLMKFVRDGINAADENTNSPFANLTVDTDGILRDEKGRKTAILIFHAGSSWLSNGDDGIHKSNDTPSDIIDAFINKSFFQAFKDSLGLKKSGIEIKGKNGVPILLDEIMLCSETSNQDGINWGIQGILVNQIARQLGIPDLYSTSSGTTAIGAFCIMDYYGFSAGRGFIPPYPSAWVRAFMGWDDVKVAPLGINKSYRVKALTSVLDNKPQDNSFADTTILLVPLNDNEYYLIENRQRNIYGDNNLFRYDTVENRRVIASYPYNIELTANVDSTTDKENSKVIQKVKNNDVSLPASGILVWHVDENIIRNHISTNLVNADSLYKGVSLVEADGVNDLGIMFQNIFFQAIYDFGGAEDVFPHVTMIDSKRDSVFGFGPFTRPSTRSNDGGHTYLNLDIKPVSAVVRQDTSYLAKGNGENHFIINYTDSLFSINLSWNRLDSANNNMWHHIVKKWPKKVAPEPHFDPVTADIDPMQKGKEIFILSKSGKLYIWPSDTSDDLYNKKYSLLSRQDLLGNLIQSADSIQYFDSIPGTLFLPSAIANKVFIPSSTGDLYIIDKVNGAGIPSITKKSLLPNIPSSYVSNYSDTSWALGCNSGKVIFGKGTDTVKTLKLSSDSAVCAIAAIREQGAQGAVAVIQTNGTLTICSPRTVKADTFTVVSEGIAPYTLVTGDINKDSVSEIIVTDSRHGIWVYNLNLSIAAGWEKKPNDWCNVYTVRADTNELKNRANFTINTAAPALADINRDGYLDIVLGGTNGVYAFNYKNVLIEKWPAYLDNKYFYHRGSVTTTPAIVTGPNREPIVLFSSATGENVTFSINKITAADPIRKTIWYKRDDGVLDSIWDLTPSFIDSLIKGDSLISPYVIPGGFLDALNGKAKRPEKLINSQLQSIWPLTTGSSVRTSPLISDLDSNKVPDLLAISSSGLVYRWELAGDLLSDSLFWPQNGFDDGRSFAYKGPQLSSLINETAPVDLYSFPNPVKNARLVTFRYKFSGPATDVRFDIYSYTGFKMYSKTSMGAAPYELSGSYPDWNEHIVNIQNFGPAVYRCRIEAKVNGKKVSKYWKMAVIK